MAAPLRLVGSLLLLLPAIQAAPAAAQSGLAASENFVVLASNKQLAEQVLQQAEIYREQIGTRWLGEPHPPSIGRATLHIKISPSEDEGTTWIVSGGRDRHRVWITGTREQVLGGSLAHELTHIVLGTEYPSRLPIWIEEGIASSYDDTQRESIRRTALKHFATTGRWPSVERLLAAASVSRNDQVAYTIAASVTQYLLTLGDEKKLIRFALSGKRDGWDRAVSAHYGLQNIQALQAGWQRWAETQLHKRSAAKSGDYISSLQRRLRR